MWRVELFITEEISKFVFSLFLPVRDEGLKGATRLWLLRTRWRRLDSVFSKWESLISLK